MDTTTVLEKDGLTEIRCLIKEYLRSEKGSAKVRDYISSVAEDDNRILLYLKGRKYRANYAWETLKRYAEVRFDEYPELFLNESHDIGLQIKNSGILAMLNSTKKWNPDAINVHLYTNFGVYFSEREILDDDIMKNGIIFIQNCSGMGFYMQECTHTLKWINVFWHAYPLKVGAVYVVNLPSYLIFLFKRIKPFFSKKLKERFILSTADKKFETLPESISPDLLPKCLVRILEDEKAFDWDFLLSKK